MVLQERKLLSNKEDVSIQKLDIETKVTLMLDIMNIFLHGPNPVRGKRVNYQK